MQQLSYSIGTMIKLRIPLSKANGALHAEILAKSDILIGFFVFIDLLKPRQFRNIQASN